MLRLLRGLTNTWVARIFFLVLAGAFALWGVAGKNPFGSDPTAIATVGGATIEVGQVQQLYQRQLAQVAQRLGNPAELPAAVRRQVAEQALDQAVTHQALQAKERRMGLAVPDAALREAVFAIPQFQGANGQFDRATMRAVLQSNGLTEAHLLDDMAAQLRDRQLLGAVVAGAAAPEVLLRQVFTYQHETRTADAVDVPFAGALPPPAPTDAQLRRWYDNHPASYSTPEYRRVRAVVLTPEVVGRDIAVSDDELRAAYDQHKSEYTQPERRSVEVITAQDEATAEKLSTQWSIGADWDTMQKAAQEAGATAVALDAATREEFPAPELAEAAFTTNAETVSPPVKGALGWYVVRVTQVQPAGNQSFDQVREKLRPRLVADKAADRIEDESSKIDDLLAGGTALKDLPGDMGLAAVTGTLDAKGVTPSGGPAPIPGSPALRQALIDAAFAMHPGDPLKLQKSPDPAPAYFAVEVEQIEPPAPRPFDQVRDAVAADWTADARRREQDAVATAIYTAVRGGRTLAEAARAAGLAVRTLPPVGRLNPVPGVPDKLVQPLFGMRLHEPTMVETPDGFTVAVLTRIDDPPLAADPVGAAQLRDRLAAAIGGDLESTYVDALRVAMHPTVNQTLFDQLSQGGE